MNSAQTADVLDQVAREYRADGYEVVVHPRPAILPGFLRGVRPDILAFRGDQKVLVEIVSGPPRDEAAELSELARAVQQHPGWRFDFVHVPAPAARQASLGAEEIRRQLEAVRAIAAAGHGAAALVLGWSAAEAALRLLADEHSVPYEPHRPRELVRTLTAAGLLEQEDNDALARGWEARNRAGHGFRMGADDGAFVSYLLQRGEEAERRGSRNPLFTPPMGDEPLELVAGRLYERRTLHERFGGQRQGGIAVSRDYPMILLFMGEEEPFGEFLPPGSVAYTGEGQVGDMQLMRGNRAILEHRQTGRELHLFQYVGRGRVRYRGQFEYTGHVQTEGPDRDGTARKMITFRLAPVRTAP
jgi:hypothetical protein